MAIGRINATLSGVQPGGLAKIVPTSVAVGSGSGSVDSNGNVTFTTVSSVSLNDVFSSTYTNYKILFNGTGSVGAELQFRFRVAGVDNSTSNYVTQYQKGYSTTNESGRATGQTSTIMALAGADRGTISCDLSNPFQSIVKTGTVHFARNANGAGPETGTYSMGFNATTSFTGFTLTASAGNISGTLSVYGYN